jgi:hypothetical protein
VDSGRRQGFWKQNLSGLAGKRRCCTSCPTAVHEPVRIELVEVVAGWDGHVAVADDFERRSWAFGSLASGG